MTATFVFTDLVDSTATAARLGPVAAEELRQMHFRLLRGAVSASGGTEVKNLGDGLMLMYSSAGRALAGAVGMQQAIEHHNRSGAESLLVRIGMSAGEAAEEDGDYFGDPVVEAARLCAAAAGGQILAGDVVRTLVGRHATQSFVEVGELDLKGLPAPLATVEVAWEPVQSAGSVPLPGRLVGATANTMFGFFGRAAELEMFSDARKQAHTSSVCQAVFLAGEAGIGKTALTAQVARAAHADGSIVLFGHADEDLGVAYQPWIEVLSTLVRDGESAWVEALRSTQRAALARLVPDIDPGTDRVTDADTERLLLWQGAVDLLAAASRAAPVLVVLDDLHWADSTSLQLLRQVIASTAPMDVTFACTYRDTELSRGDPFTKLLADLHRHANVTRISLAGLEDDELIELMAAAAGHDLDDAGVGLAHSLRRETDGNPFFTAEMLRHLAETGAIAVGSDGRWSVDPDLDELGLPSSVRDVVGRRVERLGDEAVRVLSLGAVFGREFDVDRLASLATVDEDSLLDLLDAAVAAAVVAEMSTAGRYRFAHALIQHTLYHELSATRRQRAHQRIAEMLEADAESEQASTLAELAHHWIAATRPADLDKAISYARRAGDAARDALAPDDATRWYLRTLELIERQAHSDEHQRAALLARLGAAQRQIGDPAFEDALVQAAALAEQLDDHNALVDAALGFQLFTGLTVGNDKAKGVLDAALVRIGTDPTPTRAQLLAQLALTYDAATDWQLRRDVSIEAVDIARRAGDDATFVQVVHATYSILGTPDRVDQQLADIEAAVTVADRSDDPALRFLVRVPLIWAQYQCADITRADEVLAEQELVGETIGLPYHRWVLGQCQVGRWLLAGRTSDAEAANDRALDLGTAAGEPNTLTAYGGLLIGIRQHQGRLDEFIDVLIDTARDNPSIPALRSAIPNMLCTVGRVDEAREWFNTESANGFDYPYEAPWLAAMVNVTDAAATLGDRQACATLVERLRPFADHVVAAGVQVVLGALARPMARAATVLGDHDQAEQWFATAHDIHTRLQAPFWLAMGQLDHAELCVARRAEGDLERARDLATTAATTAAEYDCSGLSRRAAALLADL